MRVFLSVYRLVAVTLLFSGLVSCIESDSMPPAACAGPCGSDEAEGTPSDAPPSASPEVPPENAAHDCTAHEIGSAFTDLGSHPGVSLSIGSNTDSDYFTLTAGAVSVDGSTGTVSPLALFGGNAFPVLVDEEGRVFGAASRSGLGKVLAFGHDNYIKATIKSSDATKILLNAIPWMSNKPAPVIGLQSGLSTLAATPNAAGYQTQYATPLQLAGVNVYINRGYTVYSDAEYTTIRNFVANGGGLIVGAQGWSFSGDVMNFSANKMLNGTGIVIAKLSDVTAGLDTVSATPPTPLLNASYSMQRLTEVVTGAANLSAADQALAASAIERAATMLPLTVQEFYNQTAPFLAAVNPTITAANPVARAANAPARAATRIRHKFTQELAPHEIVANPNATDFPGAIPNGTLRESVTVQIDGNYAGRDNRYGFSGSAVPVWRSTGTYAAPGEVVTVSVPPALVNNGVSVQVGSHSDLLWNKSSWVRFPAIVY